MARKNKDEANLLSQRIKRKSVDEENRRGKKTEFNIVVNNEEQSTFDTQQPFVPSQPDAEFYSQQNQYPPQSDGGYSPQQSAYPPPIDYGYNIHPQDALAQQESYAQQITAHVPTKEEFDTTIPVQIPTPLETPQYEPQPVFVQEEVPQTVTEPIERERKPQKQSFVSRLGKSNDNVSPSEFTFQADVPQQPQTHQFGDTTDTLNFDDRYSNMFRKKPKKTERQKSQIGDNAIDGRSGNPFKKDLPKRTKIILISIVCAIALLIPQLVFRIPATIKPENTLKISTISESSQTVIDYIKVENSTKDWDKDGILNVDDDHVYNPDADRNGVPDGKGELDFLEIGSIIQYANVTVEAQNVKMGVSKFMNYYVFSNYTGWAKITKESGIPYVYTKVGWREAEYKLEAGIFYIKINEDCLVEFVPKDTKPAYGTDFFGEKIFSNEEARYIKSYGGWSEIFATFLKSFLPITEPTQTTLSSIWYTDSYHIVKEKNIAKAEAKQPDATNYKISALDNYECSYANLQKIYDTIDNSETALVSIIQKDGSEAICFAYAYDYLGNIYLADARTSKTAGVLNIKPCAQVYHKDGQNFMREWYEIEGLGFSSAAGDIMIVY